MLQYDGYLQYSKGGKNLDRALKNIAICAYRNDSSICAQS